jgi:hypothetical protein
MSRSKKVAHCSLESGAARFALRRVPRDATGSTLREDITMTQHRPPFPSRTSLSLLALSAALASALAHAEGAVRVLECRVTHDCDDAAVCQDADQSVEFRLEPITLAADGSGSYTLRYEGRTAAMQALSEAGPFHWQQETQRHTLLVSSETHLLWHSLDFDSAPMTRIRFLDCTLRQ